MASNPTLKAKRRQLLLKALGDKCVHCGTSDKLQFDHIRPTTKEFTISSSLEFKLDRLFEEIKKCQLLCSNCHGRKTRVENGASPQKAGHGSVSTYMNHSCRCGSCRRAATDYSRVHRQKERSMAL